MPQVNISFTDVNDFLEFMEKMKKVAEKYGLKVEIRRVDFIKHKSKTK
jgi:predicted amino acid-binding ACT domain protein